MSGAGGSAKGAGGNFFRLEAAQRLPASMDAAWDFFSNPRNLAEITPPELGLAVENELPARMRAGMIIRYRVRPLLGIPIRWVTEITHVEEGRFFVDEQRFGPYRFWHHRHDFREVEGGVEARDLVHYMLPLGPLSAAANALLVRPRLERIFAYREEALAARFGRTP